MNTKSFTSCPTLSFPLTTLLLTLFFIFLLYIPRLLYLYLRAYILYFWKRNMAKRISHFEALDLARVERGEMNGDGDGNGDGDRKRKSTQRWTWDLEKENAEAEAKEEEENEWVTKGEMAKGWVCEGEEKGEESRRRVAVESGWLHFVGRDEDGEGNGEGNGGEEKKKEKEGWSEIRMEKEIDA